MRTFDSVTISVFISLASLCRVDAQAQENRSIRRFGDLLHPHGAVLSTAGHAQARSASERHDQQVQRNIARHRDQAIRLRAAGRKSAGGPAVVTSPLGVTGTGSISGTVCESDGSTPVPYAYLDVYDQFGLFRGGAFMDSSAGSAYQVTGLASGSYYVQVDIYGGQFTAEYYNGVTDWRNATLVNVVDGVETRGINFIRQQHYGTVAGRVTADDGTPMTECVVYVYDMSEDIVGYSNVDAAADFFIGGLPTGDYKLQASSTADDNYVAQWFGGAATFGKASVVHVVEPGTTGGLALFLSMGGQISGTVVGQGGDTNQPGSCSVYAMDADGNEAGYAQFGSGGSFQIPRLATGSYKLEIDYYGLGGYVSGWYDGAADAEHATPVRVTAPGTTNVALTLARGGAISGVVFYNPPGGIAVIAYNDTRTETYTEYTDQTGHFTISQLPAGRYRLLASTLKSYSYSAGQAIDQWYGNAPDFAHAASVEVHASDTTGGIAFTLQQGGTIAGSVFDPNGLPLGGAGTVYACDVRGAQVQSAAVNSYGMYQIAGLPTGLYKLSYSYSGQDHYASQWYNGQPSCAKSAVINVTAPSYVGNANFNLKKAGTVNGFVADNSGARLSSDDHEIELMVYEGDAGNYVGGQMQSFNGGFQGDLLSGSYKVGFFNFYWNSIPEQDSLAVAYYENGKSFADPSSTTVALASGATVTLNDTRMERTASGITGTVFDRGTGSAISSGVYTLLAFDDQGRPVTGSGYESYSGSISGSYRLAGLRPGKYYLLALGGTLDAGYTSTQWYGNIDVSPDSVMSVPMPVVPPGAVAVTVGPGTTSGIDFHMGVTTAIREVPGAASPRSFVLEQNFPNPFNPTTSIRYQIPSANRVTLEVFDMLGRSVATLQNGLQEPGTYTATFNATGLASGFYFYRLRAGNFTQAKKLLILR